MAKRRKVTAAFEAKVALEALRGDDPTSIKVSAGGPRHDPRSDG